MSELKRRRSFRLLAGVAVLIALVSLAFWWIGRAAPAAVALKVRPANADQTADTAVQSKASVVATTTKRGSPRVTGEPTQTAAALGTTSNNQGGISFDRVPPESKLLAMQFSDVGPLLSNWRRGEPNFLSACALLECGFLAKAQNGQQGFSNVSVGSFGPNGAYYAASCQPWIDQIGAAKFAHLISNPLWDECMANGILTGEAGQAQHDRILEGPITDAELIAMIAGETESGVFGQIWLQRDAIGRALRDKRMILGLNWDETWYRLDEAAIGNLSWLIAAKLHCVEPGACRPHSLLLNIICKGSHTLDCHVNSDLSQIARDSLTPREYRWWQDATVPAGKKKG